MANLEEVENHLETLASWLCTKIHHLLLGRKRNLSPLQPAGFDQDWDSVRG
jgi:hypothetical protein